MAHNRMDDFGVAIDPRTGELSSAGPLWRAVRRPRPTKGGSSWRPLTVVLAIVLALVVGVFAVALLGELL